MTAEQQTFWDEMKFGVPFAEGEPTTFFLMGVRNAYRFEGLAVPSDEDILAARVTPPSPGPPGTRAGT